MKKREAFARMMNSYYRFDRCAWILLGCFILGFLFSAILIRYQVDFVVRPADEYVQELIFEFPSLGFWNIFLRYLFYMTISYVFVLLLGLFVPGEALSFVYLAYEGVRTGGIFSLIYQTYQMQGVLFVFAVLLIPTFFYVLCLIYAFRGTVRFSLSLLRQFLGESCENLIADYKAFLIRSLLCPLSLIGCALCGAGLQKCFAVLFSFG